MNVAACADNARTIQHILGLMVSWAGASAKRSFDKSLRFANARAAWWCVFHKLQMQFSTNCRKHVSRRQQQKLRCNAPANDFAGFAGFQLYNIKTSAIMMMIRVNEDGGQGVLIICSYTWLTTGQVCARCIHSVHLITKMRRVYNFRWSFCWCNQEPNVKNQTSRESGDSYQISSD